MGVKYLHADGIVIRQGIYQESLSQQADLGHFIDLEDGRRFRYCKAEGAIAKARMCQTAAVDSDHMNVTQTGILAIGDKDDLSIVVTVAPTKNDYAEGFLVINNDTGEGEMYKIRTNSGASPCIVSLYDAIRVATAAGTEISMVQSKYKAVIVVPYAAQPTGVPVGVPNITITTGGYFFWAQTRGYCVMVVETGITVGIPVQTADSSVNGGAETAQAATDCIYGIAPYSSSNDGDFCIVNLMLE